MSTSPNRSSIKLYQEIHGDGEPILCIHGLGASLFSWRFLVKPFSQGRRLILVDLRGFGSSPKPRDSDYSALVHVDDIYDLIVKENLTNLTLIGNSLGGGIAMMLAMRLSAEQPSRLKKLVLLDSAAYEEYMPHYVKFMRTSIGAFLSQLIPAGIATRFVLRASYYDRKKITPDQIAAYAAPLKSREGRYALRRTIREIVPANLNEILKGLNKLTVPTLIVSGREDAIIPLKVAELLHEAIPNSKLVILDQCGHIPQEERPDETIALISEFLEAPPTA